MQRIKNQKNKTISSFLSVDPWKNQDVYGYLCGIENLIETCINVYIASKCLYFKIGTITRINVECFIVFVETCFPTFCYRKKRKQRHLFSYDFTNFDFNFAVTKKRNKTFNSRIRGLEIFW